MTIEFLAVQPHIWIVPLIAVGCVLLCLLGIFWYRTCEVWDWKEIAGILLGWLAGVAAAVLLIVSVWQLVPFNSKYWNYYTVTGTVTSYSNRLDNGTGGFTGVPIFTLEGSDMRYVSRDNRLASTIGEEVSLRCDIGWRWYGTDVYSCALGPNAGE